MTRETLEALIDRMLRAETRVEPPRSPRFASTLIGQAELYAEGIQRRGRAGGKNFGSSLSVQTEDAVMPSEIERLPGLSGYLQVPSRPEWFQAKVARREIPQRTATFVGV